MPLKSNTPRFTRNCCHNLANSLHGVRLVIMSEGQASKETILIVIVYQECNTQKHLQAYLSIKAQKSKLQLVLKVNTI